MSRLIYLRGSPGSGKHTIGQLLAKELGCGYLWFHDLYREERPNALKIARTILPALAVRLATGNDLVFTRPSKLASTVEQAVTLAGHMGYTTKVIKLVAPRETLLQRVTSREPQLWRVSNEQRLDEYLGDLGGPEPYGGEHIVFTGTNTPEKCVQWIREVLGAQS